MAAPPRARTIAERRGAAAARKSRRAEVTDPGIVMEAAANFLSVRSRSIEETRRRLRHLGYPPALCEEVVERLTELDYLDDHAFATAWVASRDRARPRGEGALRRELQLKGISTTTIGDVLAERATNSANGSASAGDPSSPGDADTAAAERLLERRASTLQREPDLRHRRQKAYALLARNGFAPDVCHEVAASLVAET